ncbi:NAD(P)-dependent oxidoreductase [Parvularcula lutaonensis]|nr:NAD(P)-dependent oxidoreductase [Parvularcula lutaonensis]
MLFIGLGYSARPLAQRLRDQGWDITATTRDRTKAMALAGEGFRPVVWESPAPLPASAAEEADAVIVSTAPNEGQCPAATALDGVSFWTRPRVLYLSSSGVYGDFGGEWVDEDTPCNPGTERGKERLAAENQWQALADRTGAELVLCRLAGIYGPGRSAVDSLSGNTRGARAGLSRRLVKEGQVFNRIHRDDIARGLYALLQADEPPSIVNFSDDLPSPSAEPIAYAAELLGIDPPPVERYEDIEEELSPMARSFYAENKRLRNDRLKALVGDLLYPTYREGLKAVAAAR